MNFFPHPQIYPSSWGHSADSCGEDSLLKKGSVISLWQETEVQLWRGQLVCSQLEQWGVATDASCPRDAGSRSLLLIGGFLPGPGNLAAMPELRGGGLAVGWKVSLSE